MDPPTIEAKLASDDEDRISNLPDDVIVHILSRLKLEESLATSLLSKRWRYLWITHTTHLDFKCNTGADTDKFIGLVDGVLQQYDNSGDPDRALHRFSIMNYNICSKYKSCIGRWIKFALSKQVKELHLLLWDPESVWDRYAKEYMLSRDIFADVNGDLETWQQNSGHIPPSYRSYGLSWIVGLRYLKHLKLVYVTIEGKFIDYLLANCSALERLFLKSCRVWKSSLRVSGQSLKLKDLCIEFCRSFTYIDINNVNLVSLTYKGSELPLYIDNVPRLVDLRIGLGLPKTFQHILDGLWNSISHVQILKLDFDSMDDSVIPKMPTLRNVIQLEITLTEIDDVSLLPFARFIEACPSLQRFTLKVLDFDLESSTVEEIKMQRIFGLPLRHLQLVEFCGLYGGSTHYELVQYLIDNAVVLRKLIVDPSVAFTVLHERANAMNKSRERAKQQLEGKLPSRINLLII